VRHTIARMIGIASLLTAIQVTPVLRAQAEPSPVSAWFSGAFVQIRWDLRSGAAGYNVYRLQNGGSIRVNEELIGGWKFIDWNPPDQAMVTYLVTAVDSAGSEAQIGQSEELVVRVFGAQPSASSQTFFDQNDIISDRDMTDGASMTLAQVQAFLSSQGSYLATYSYAGKSASQHIFDAAQANGISPQVVLTTLQKEQMLITSRAATSQQLALAMGWDPTNKFQSHNFGDQVFYGTKQFRRNFDEPWRNGWQVGQAHSVDDGKVIPVNAATTSLYIYTPVIGTSGAFGGNYLFWQLWFNHFRFGASSNALPALTSSLAIAPNGPYTVGQTIQGSFVITNRTGSPVTLDELLIGGRLDNDWTVRDFPALSGVRLPANQSYTYNSNFTLNESGTYRFFPAYRIGAVWHIALYGEIPADSGLTTVVSITPVPRSTSSPDAQARTDMTNRAAKDSRFGAADFSSFGVNADWDPNFELRWMGFGFRGGKKVFIYHAMYKWDRTFRLITFFDPDANVWVGWELIR
jgi:hypothetical protein